MNRRTRTRVLAQQGERILERVPLCKQKGAAAGKLTVQLKGSMRPGGCSRLGKRLSECRARASALDAQLPAKPAQRLSCRLPPPLPLMLRCWCGGGGGCGLPLLLPLTTCGCERTTAHRHTERPPAKGKKHNGWHSESKGNEGAHVLFKQGTRSTSCMPLLRPGAPAAAQPVRG